MTYSEKEWIYKFLINGTDKWAYVYKEWREGWEIPLYVVYYYDRYGTYSVLMTWSRKPSPKQIEKRLEKVV